MLRQLHHMLSANPVTRSAERRVVSRIKNAMGVHDPFCEIALLAAAVRPAAVLDIGSHKGLTIRRLLEETADVSVHGFEPTPDSYATLRSVYGGHPRVHLHNFALGNTNGQSVFHCNANEQTNSLLDNDIGNTASFSASTRHVDTIEVQIRTLDTWAAQSIPDGPLIVKADIQGAEGFLLDGGSQTFKERVVAFYSETQLAPMYKGQTDFHDLHDRLTSEFGFVLRDIYPCMHDTCGAAVQTDAMWVKPDTLEHLI